jgi:hypothetical protein
MYCISLFFSSAFLEQAAFALWGLFSVSSTAESFREQNCFGKQGYNSTIKLRHNNISPLRIYE